ncbi:MAG: hypothetical protein AB7S38_40290 [Vulcanimicrobiota bacterium]
MAQDERFSDEEVADLADKLFEANPLFFYRGYLELAEFCLRDAEDWPVDHGLVNRLRAGKDSLEARLDQAPDWNDPTLLALLAEVDALRTDLFSELTLIPEHPAAAYKDWY